VPTVVVAVALLFVVSGSGVSDVTFAVFVSVVPSRLAPWTQPYDPPHILALMQASIYTPSLDITLG
jgi:hypothetical protein